MKAEAEVFLSAKRIVLMVMFNREEHEQHALVTHHIFLHAYIYSLDFRHSVQVIKISL